MGNIMTVTGRKIMRKTRRFNVENRAHRFIEQDKLPAAPKHPSTSKHLESLSEDPNKIKELNKKNTQLDENLKLVYVKSLHKPEPERNEEEERLRKSKLPQDKRSYPDLKYGHEMPLFIPKGKYSLPQVIDMIADYCKDPKINTPQALADQYSLDLKVVESILFYFRFFKIEGSNEESDRGTITNKVLSKFAENTLKKLKVSTDAAALPGTIDVVKDEESGQLLKLHQNKGKEKTIEKEVIEDTATAIIQESHSKNASEVSDTQRDKLESHPEHEIAKEMDDKDSVYKNVANRKKKKTLN